MAKLKTIEQEGETYVLIPAEQYADMAKQLGVDENSLPPYPPADDKGLRPALDYVRTSIARSIIAERKKLGWGQAELARRAKLPVGTLNRIERAKVTPDKATIARIDKALKAGRRAKSAKTSPPSAAGIAKLAIPVMVRGATDYDEHGVSRRKKSNR